MEDRELMATYGNQLSLEGIQILQCFFWQHVSPFQVLVSSCIILYHWNSSLQKWTKSADSWGPSTVYQDPTPTVSRLPSAGAGLLSVAFACSSVGNLDLPWQMVACATFGEGWRVWNHWMLGFVLDSKCNRIFNGISKGWTQNQRGYRRLKVVVSNMCSCYVSTVSPAFILTI